MQTYHHCINLNIVIIYRAFISYTIVDSNYVFIDKRTVKGDQKDVNKSINCSWNCFTNNVIIGSKLYCRSRCIDYRGRKVLFLQTVDDTNRKHNVDVSILVVSCNVISLVVISR